MFCKNELASEDKSDAVVIVFSIKGIFLFKLFITPFIFSIDSEPYFTVLSIVANLFLTSIRDVSIFVNFGNSSCNFTPVSFSKVNAISPTVFINSLFTWLWIDEAPLSVILGAIAFIFSFTEYIILAFVVFLDKIDAKSSEKLLGISIVA